MARGRERHQARQAAVAGLGRQLSRRARSGCELCGTSTSLSVIEIEPVDPEEPLPERAAMLCARCAGLVGGDRPREVAPLRFLEESVWAEVLPVQLAAVRLTRSLAADGVDWAITTLDGLYLDPEVESLLG